MGSDNVIHFPAKDSCECGAVERADALLVCLHCKKEHRRVIEIGVIRFLEQCPYCELHKCVLKGEIFREGRHWVCNCGCDTFRVHMEEGVYCPVCGNVFRW